MFYVHVLRSTVSGRLYVGSTKDIERRFRQHNAGRSKATRSGVPWVLVHVEPAASRADAVGREHFLKTGVGRDWLRARLLNSG